MADEMEYQAAPVNTRSILIGGTSGTGKSTSLMNLRKKDRWTYLNCEGGKPLPFPHRFNEFVVTDPYQVYQAMQELREDTDNDGTIVDSLTFLMDMYESVYVRPAVNGQKAWGDFADFARSLMLQQVPLYGKPVIFLAHVLEAIDEATADTRVSVPVKGSLKGQGLEAFFTLAVHAEKRKIKDLQPYIEGNDLLNITEEEEELGYKHVFQTRLTKDTVGKRIRGPLKLFTKAQTFMDNDVQLLLDHVERYYAGA